MQLGRCRSAGKGTIPGDVWEETQTVNGLTVPKRYTVYWTNGRVAVKDGEVKDWSFAANFDASKLDMPEGGTPDQSIR